MNEIRKALFLKLKNDATLTNLLADGNDGVYHKVAPPEAKTPYVIFGKHGGRPRWTYQDHTQWDLWLVKGVDRAESSSVVEDIAARVETLLSDAALTITGKRHLYLRRKSDVEYPENDGGQTFHHCGALYELVTQPT